MTRATATNRLNLRSLLADLPRILSGRSPGLGQRVAQAMLKAGGLEALSIVREAYVVKARGGTDEAGITWQKLSPRTIAYGRRHPGLNARRKRAEAKGRGSRPLLSESHDRLWRQVYSQTYARCQAQGMADAAAVAAGHAWNVVKAAGGRTILGEYGGTSVEIGRDTGRLLASLSPGSRDSILDVAAASVTVGTNVEYAEHFHARRPLWPEHWPDVWQERIAAAMVKAAGAVLAREVR